MAWTAVNDATGYKLYYGTSSGTYTGTANLGNVTSKTLKNVDSGTYYLAIKAFHAQATSGYSTEVSVTLSASGGSTDATAPTTTASPSGGTFTSSQSVTLTCTDNSGGSGCSGTYYTADGTTPTTASTVYSGAISLSSTTTLKFFSKDASGNQEAVKTETYTILSATQVADIEGNVYNTVTIGTQKWMKENLKVTKYRDGTAIGTTTANISSETSPKYQWPSGGDESYVSTYGRLYTWYAATDSRGVCPSGWHLPTDTELTTLTTYLGGTFSSTYTIEVAGDHLKEAGTSHWRSPNTGADNSSGFTGLPGGTREYNPGSFGLLYNRGYWWLATEGAQGDCGYAVLLYGEARVGLLTGVCKYGFSVRCVGD